MSQYSATINLFQDSFNKIGDKKVGKQQGPAIVKILQDWVDEARAVNTEFLVYNIWVRSQNKINAANYFENSGILYLNPDEMFNLSPNNTIPGDPNHPNIFVHRDWADCFVKKIQF